MGQGGRGNTSTITTGTYYSTYTVSRLVRVKSEGEFVSSRRRMASGHSRSSSVDSNASSSAGYIEHTVSRLDTLAGVAIKYGVEVADVKRMNGLVSDLQMFALKTLKIPLPGRHPLTASPTHPRSSGRPPRIGKQPNSVLAQILIDSTEPEKRPVTSAMGLLRGYYGLSTAAAAREGAEGTEMAVYKSDTDYHSEDELFSPFQPFSPQETGNVRHQNDSGSSDSEGRISNLHGHQSERHPGAGKAKVIAQFEPFSTPSRGTAVMLEAPGGDASEIERANERLFRRRAKGESAAGPSVPDMASESIMPPAPEAEVSDRINVVPLGKSSALRQKIPPLDDPSDIVLRPVVNSSLNGWHTNSDSSSSAGQLAGSAVRALSTSLLSGKAVEGLISKIRRSASNSTLHEEKRSYKSDSSGTLMVSQGSLQSGVISSVLEGFPKAGGAMRRNKAALD